MDNLGFTFSKYMHLKNRIIYRCTFYYIHKQLCRAQVVSTKGDDLQKDIIEHSGVHNHSNPLGKLGKFKEIKNLGHEVKYDGSKVKTHMPMEASSSKPHSSTSYKYNAQIFMQQPCASKETITETYVAHDGMTHTLDVDQASSSVCSGTSSPVVLLEDSDHLPLWSNCRACFAPELIPPNASLSALMILGSEHVLKLHRDKLTKGATVVPKKLILQLFPELQIKQAKNAAPLCGAACIPNDMSEYACCVCGEAVVNMPDQTENDSELINHAATHLKHGQSMNSGFFWKCYPGTAPKYVVKVETMTI